MSEVLSVAGEGAISFGRRPELPLDNTFSRQLASNAIPPYKFAFARTALKYGLKLIGFERGDALLVPELICESALEPLYELGIEKQYYPIGLSLEPEWRQLEKIITKSTKAILVVHYFGQPQPIPDCIEFCQDHSLILIEDNAHGFGGTFDGQLLRTFGDIGVSAPRKSFPVINGAYLYIADGGDLNLSTLQPQPSASSSLKHWLKCCIKHIPFSDVVMEYRRRIIEHRRRLGPPAPYGSQEAYRGLTLQNDYGMNKSAESYLIRQDIEHIREVRRQIYHMWQQWTGTQGLTPVFPSLSTGAIPLIFPAFSESASCSLKWYERGHHAGVDIHSWPTLPQAIVERNSEAMRLWERMVCFPIHQEMNVRLLERRLAVL